MKIEHDDQRLLITTDDGELLAIVEDLGKRAFVTLHHAGELVAGIQVSENPATSG